MNSLLGGIGQSLMGGATGTNMPSILLQAVGAAMRGESPQTFMQNLANQHPQLKKYDLNNLQGTAQTICQQNGVNMQDAINKIDNIMGPLNR